MALVSREIIEQVIQTEQGKEHVARALEDPGQVLIPEHLMDVARDLVTEEGDLVAQVRRAVREELAAFSAEQKKAGQEQKKSRGAKSQPAMWSHIVLAMCLVHTRGRRSEQDDGALEVYAEMAWDMVTSDWWAGLDPSRFQCTPDSSGIYLAITASQTLDDFFYTIKKVFKRETRNWGHVLKKFDTAQLGNMTVDEKLVSLFKDLTNEKTTFRKRAREDDDYSPRPTKK